VWGRSHHLPGGILLRRRLGAAGDQRSPHLQPGALRGGDGRSVAAQELAPVFTALMITARAGSGWRPSSGRCGSPSRIDALTTFAVDPVQYLVTPGSSPRFDDADHDDGLQHPGLIGAYLYSIFLEHIDLGQFLEQFRYWTDPKDYIIGATKAAVFGVTLSVAACFQGFNVRGGAKEVGLATTRAVVAGSVSVLVSDYFLIDIFHILWPYQS